jgi:hypothetical protein
MATPGKSERWLHGPAPDLLFGCALWYVAAFGILCFAGEPIRTGMGAGALPLLALFFGTPHYGATLLRVYGRREDRRAYAIFSVWATLLIVVVFALGVHSALLGSLVLTTYLTWSPWHYTGQNYGLAVMFLRRRGVALPPAVKRVVYASFMLSFLLTFLAQHAGVRGSYVPLSYAGAGYRFLSIGLPQPYTSWAISALAVAYVVSLIAAGVLLLRRASARDLLPAAMLALSQALWFSVPLLARHFGIAQSVEPLGADFDTFYFFWIAVGHSVQYVWVTSYYARRAPGWTGLQPYLLKALLAGAVVWTLPVVLFAPGLLGRLSFDAGLGILVASTVNIHHFVLDGAIWKLRDGRVARILLRPASATGPESAGVTGRRWRAALVWALGVACIVITVVVKWESRAVSSALERGDLGRAIEGTERLAWIGHDSATARRAVADDLARRGNTERAEREYQRALELHPDPVAWYRLGSLYAQAQRFEDALAAYGAGLALDPDQDVLHHAVGMAWLELDRPEKAREAFARAAALEPDHSIHQLMLERTDRLLEAQPAPVDRGS